MRSRLELGNKWLTCPRKVGWVIAIKLIVFGESGAGKDCKVEERIGTYLSMHGMGCKGDK